MITIYTRPGCGKCVATERALDSAGLPYLERSMTDPRAEAEALATGFRTLPIVVDGDIAWCDMRPDMIEQAAERAAAAAGVAA